MYFFLKKKYMRNLIRQPRALLTPVCLCTCGSPYFFMTHRLIAIGYFFPFHRRLVMFCESKILIMLCLGIASLSVLDLSVLG
ncbi:hypothetical protein B0O99DRAFT_634122 [Bisporella sp. PMI_857]|nr:hypothetical protein B0O99DRAFT_634122 [Bisporella sp. PMI_857]